ncbi:ankyrin repeat domain-containing protein [Prosthecobacter vanneervenii]|uniref:Uncharacterized protein n=1 Tax=Prosthecobacter vanneervenii TaxID=48466 RepID=A0A7W7Y8I2_9BACT|nr:hypothetical protein [Prosthecobacter vanneervenii]MBB5031598.1 hypothetical protein [Prosthecobacter vanneervenii]
MFRWLDDRHADNTPPIRSVRMYRSEGAFPWIKPLTDEPPDAETPVFSEALAQEWVNETSAKDWPHLLARVAAAKREIPRGWFRWLHHTSLARFEEEYSNNGPSVMQQLQFRSEWHALSQSARLDSKRLGELLPLLEIHSWEVGCYGLHRLAESGWRQLSPRARGRLLAGMANSESLCDEELVWHESPSAPGAFPPTPAVSVSTWLMARLSDAEFDAESVLEIACHAVRNEDPQLLARILHAGAARLGESIERMEPFHPESWTRNVRDFDVTGYLSHRVVDMVLEAAILRRYRMGQRLALASGASPNIRIWELESCSNEQFTALSYAIDQHDFELVELLLAHPFVGADEVSSKSLFLAIRMCHHKLAERILDRGVPFDRGDFIEGLDPSLPGSKPGWKNFPELPQCEPADFERAERLSSGLPLSHPSAVPWFIHGCSMMGGSCSTILAALLHRDDLKHLQYYHSRGLPLRMTTSDFAIALAVESYDCLCWLMQQWGAPKSFLLKLRREIPAFGTRGRLWMVRADARRVGLLDTFDTSGQEPLHLPDGGRLWMDFSGLVIQDDQLGPSYKRQICIDPRRRPGFVVLRSVSITWASCRHPKSDYELQSMIPLIKEMNGQFFYTGMTLGTLGDQRGLSSIHSQLKSWSQGTYWKQMRPGILERAMQNNVPFSFKTPQQPLPRRSAFTALNSLRQKLAAFWRSP